MNLQQDLYAKDVREKKTLAWDEIPLRPTLIRNIEGNVKLLFGNRESQEFSSVVDAEKWAEENNIKIRIRFGAAASHSDISEKQNGKLNGKPN